MGRIQRPAACVMGLIALVVLGWASANGGSGSPGDSPPASTAQSTATPAPTAAATAPPLDAGSGTLAAEVLEQLAVKGRAPRTGYSRGQFGQTWRDLDRNGCDQRNDVLRRDLTDVTVTPGTHGCVVLTGVLVSPYSGLTVPFTRGTSTSQEVPIDHVVALSDAWQKGAQQWTPEKRESLANDFLELVAADRTTNSRKSDGDAATWLPPLKTSRCAYVARQVAVKAAYGLWVTPAEHDAIARVLTSCPDQHLPTSTGIPLGTS